MELKYNPVRINFNELKDKVREKAREYLQDTIITEEDMEAFSEGVKFITINLLEKYYRDVDKFFNEGEFKINNIEVLDEFNDRHSGYRAQMKEWIEQNDIKVKKIEISLDSAEDLGIDRNVDKKTILLASIGTITVVGLVIFTSSWIALGFGIIALGILIKNIINRRARNKEMLIKIQNYKINIAKKKAELVNGLLDDLEKWLKKAEEKSNEILLSFNLINNSGDYE